MQNCGELRGVTCSFDERSSRFTASLRRSNSVSLALRAQELSVAAADGIRREPFTVVQDDREEASAVKLSCEENLAEKFYGIASECWRLRRPVLVICRPALVVRRPALVVRRPGRGAPAGAHRRAHPGGCECGAAREQVYGRAEARAADGG